MKYLEIHNEEAISYLPLSKKLLAISLSEIQTHFRTT